MNRKKLANEVTEFCLAYGIFNISGEVKELKQRIEEQFIDVIFVEGLINMIIVKARDHENIDKKGLIKVLSDLERLRLELEYKTPQETSAKC